MSDKYYRSTYLNVDLNAIVSNFQVFQKLHPSKTVIPVVKANGYGLGSIMIARQLMDNGAEFFAVATLDEAIELRMHGINAKIYAQVAGHEAMVSMVSLGLGIAMVPKIVLDNSPLKDRVQVLSDQKEAPPGFEIGLVVLHKALPDAALKALWEIAQSLKNVNSLAP